MPCCINVYSSKRCMFPYVWAVLNKMFTLFLPIRVQMWGITHNTRLRREIATEERAAYISYANGTAKKTRYDCVLCVCVFSCMRIAYNISVRNYNQAYTHIVYAPWACFVSAPSLFSSSIFFPISSIQCPSFHVNTQWNVLTYSSNFA